MFVDCMSSEWDKTHESILEQVEVFSPDGPSRLLAPTGLGVIEAPPQPANNTGKQEERESLRDTRQELGLLAGPQASLAEPIPRPSLDFQKAQERLAGLEMVDRAMGMRLHIPQKRITKF